MKIAKMNQEVLLRAIRKKIGNKSINEEISNILNISYDASHRRTSMKSKFTIDETVELCKNFQISMDQLFCNDNQIIVKTTLSVLSPKDLPNYFKSSLEFVQDYKNLKDTKIYYSAKDIPFFYTISDNLLSKFKIYVWVNMLQSNENFEAFEKFVIENQYTQPSEELKNWYEKSNVTEIWNETSISSIFNQIKFYFEIGLMNFDSIEKIMKELKDLLLYIENKTIKKSDNYQLYVHELTILNNSILLQNEDKMTLVVPYNMFGYLITEDRGTCEKTLNFFKKEIDNSKSVNFSGNSDRKKFFNRMHTKINDFLNITKNQQIL